MIENKNCVFIFTLHSSLGDYLILSHVLRVLKNKGFIALAIHLQNPHIPRQDFGQQEFFNAFDLNQMLNLKSKIKSFKLKGFNVLGLQQAPGSLRGFYFLSLLKKLNYLDWIVDFNLIDADIITHPRGEYIVDWHLHQIEDLSHCQFSPQSFDLTLPDQYQVDPNCPQRDNIQTIAIHPWTGKKDKKSFALSWDKWLNIFEFLVKRNQKKLIICGKDKGFNNFKLFVLNNLGESPLCIFSPSLTVNDLIKDIQRADGLITLNTAAVHLALALKRRQIVLQGSNIKIWAPRQKDVILVTDRYGQWVGADKSPQDCFKSVDKLESQEIIDVIENQWFRL